MGDAKDYADLYFAAEQLMLSADETVLVAKDIFTRAPAAEEIVGVASQAGQEDRHELGEESR